MAQRRKEGTHEFEYFINASVIEAFHLFFGFFLVRLGFGRHEVRRGEEQRVFAPEKGGIGGRPKKFIS
jgi:hypothetical protein